MWYVIAVICLVIYFLCSMWFLFGSFLQLHLLWKARRKIPAVQVAESNASILPTVTIQVPVYNERYVIAGLLESLGHMNYPTHLFEIQVLDDSTDETSKIIDQSAQTLRNKGFDITIIRRQDRSGYKAGALEAGLKHCKGELISIFDADFLPDPEFLNKMVRYFTDAKVGGVQARWTHQNLHQNSLTIVQAFLLDSHFNLEQTGRAAAGYFLNFNGTAGVWRKSCIIDSGGWNGNVLTEDLELSYRAQLRGWKFKYDNEIVVPAELPADMVAFKTQQFRWAKGMAQTARKHLKEVSKYSAPFTKKMHATFHLLSSMSFLVIMGNMLLALPILVARNYFPEFRGISNIIFWTGITIPVLLLYYYHGTKSTLSRMVFWTYLPAFLTVYLALSVQNSVAVIQGLMGHISPFVRTPKQAGENASTYRENRWTAINWLELTMIIYTSVGIILSIYWSDYFLLSFLGMTLAGLIALLFPAIRSLGTFNKQPFEQNYYRNKRTGITSH